MITGNLRLLLGMLRANQPWRLAVKLSRALTAAFATAVLALVTSDIWRLADNLGPLRLTLLAVGSVVREATYRYHLTSSCQAPTDRVEPPRSGEPQSPAA